MAKGRQKHQARLDAVGLLGKDLARRAGRRCELCEDRGELHPYDTAPEQEPSLEALILLCARCRGLADGGREDPQTLRFLEGAIWSPLPVAASLARDALGRVDAPWARSAMELVVDA